jgi:hypothetical protein
MSKKDIQLRQYQKDAIESVEADIMFGGKNIVLDSPPACVPGWTEFLTPNGWKRIDQYTENDLVCQWNIDGTTEFVKPISYIKEKSSDSFVLFKNKFITLQRQHI